MARMNCAMRKGSMKLKAMTLDDDGDIQRVM